LCNFWFKSKMTAADDGQDVVVLRRSSAGARTAGPRTDRRSATCTTRVRRGNEGNRCVSGAASTWGRRAGLGRRATSGGGVLGGVQACERGVAARRHGAERGRLFFILLSLSLNMNNSKNWNRSASNDEYESFRSGYPL
jgi:hypothetical protein